MNKYYRSLVLADGQDHQPHVELKRGVGYGQSPALAQYPHPDGVNEGFTGDLEPGDRIQFLMGASPRRTFPEVGCAIRVQVATHDGRRVGHSGNAVWIVWPGVQEARRIFRIVRKR